METTCEIEISKKSRCLKKKAEKQQFQVIKIFNSEGENGTKVRCNPIRSPLFSVAESTCFVVITPTGQKYTRNILPNNTQPIPKTVYLPRTLTITAVTIQLNVLYLEGYVVSLLLQK